MYSIIIIAEENLGSDSNPFTIFESYDDLSDARKLYDYMDANCNTPISLVKYIDGEIFSIMLSNSDELELYLREFITPVNDNKEVTNVR